MTVRSHVNRRRTAVSRHPLLRRCRRDGGRRARSAAAAWPRRVRCFSARCGSGVCSPRWWLTWDRAVSTDVLVDMVWDRDAAGRPAGAACRPTWPGCGGCCRRRSSWSPAAAATCWSPTGRRSTRRPSWTMSPRLRDAGPARAAATSWRRGRRCGAACPYADLDHPTLQPERVRLSALRLSAPGAARSRSAGGRPDGGVGQRAGGAARRGPAAGECGRAAGAGAGRRRAAERRVGRLRPAAHAPCRRARSRPVAGGCEPSSSRSCARRLPRGAGAGRRPRRHRRCRFR